MIQKADRLGPICFVEDSEADFVASKRALKQIGLQVELKHFIDGESILRYLTNPSSLESHDWAKPSIILLDLNMPGLDGREVLTLIKSNNSIKSIPIVIFTTSNANHDVEYCFANGANSYIQKPVDFKEYKEALSVFCDYWFSVSKL